MRVLIYDTTLRDGSQGEKVSFSVEDKLAIARRLDELGIDYIEGGWPGSNPRDKEFFRRLGELELQHARMAAFGSTRYPKNKVDNDPNVRALIEAGTPVVTIFGKSWDLHTQRALGITEEENLALISETVQYLKDNGREVVYDAEHFFDGYISNPSFALRTLEAAKSAGADTLALCDTNGGTITTRLVEIFAEARKRFDGVIGIHTHNDCDLAVANSIAAVEQGATHVQGTFNGYGERCGNANLCSIIPVLELKLGHITIGRERLAHLASVAGLVSELANLSLRNDAPFVGRSAFAHKGGVHVSAVLKDSATYEHIAPDLVGNRRRVLISDLSGRSNIFYKLKERGLSDKLTDAARRELLDRIKQLEYEGYELEAAEGSFELLVRQTLHPEQFFFALEGFKIITEKTGEGAGTSSTVTMTIRAKDGLHSATATAPGPVHAMDLCLRRCLSKLYPQIGDIRLTDYKVRVLDSKRGTAARVRVLVEWTDHRRSWTTVGVSENVLEASWNAMVDSVHLELRRLAEQDASVEKVVEDYCWGV